MVTEAFERAGRKLRQHQRKLDAAVGTRLGQVELVLFDAWIEELGGRCRVLYMRPPTLRVDTCMRLARAVLGPEWLEGAQWFDTVSGAAWFVVPLDRVAITPGPWLLGCQLPRWIRWFNGYRLAVAVGDVDYGRLTWDSYSMELEGVG